MTGDPDYVPSPPLREIIVYPDGVQVTGMLLFLIALTAAGIAFAIWAPPVNVFTVALGIFVAGLSLVGVVRGIPMLFRLRKPAIIMNPTSIRDLRMSSVAIPWASVQGVGTWYYLTQFGKRRPMGVHLGVPSEFMQKYETTRFYRFMGPINRAFGYTGIWISPFGTEIGAKELYQWCTAYWHASKAKDEPTHV